MSMLIFTIHVHFYFFYGIFHVKPSSYWGNPLGDADPLIPRWPIGSQGWCDGAETDEEIVGHSVGKPRLEL